MDLTLAKKGDYVVQAALALARHHRPPRPPWTKLRELARDTQVPPTYLSQILGCLVRARLVESQAGKQGGYRLLRDPGDTNLLEVVEAGEGPLQPNRCTLRGGPCHWEAMCPIHPVWSKAAAEFRAVLERTSLADLLATDAALAAGTATIPRDSHRLTAAGAGAAAPPRAGETLAPSTEKAESAAREERNARGVRGDGCVY